MAGSSVNFLSPSPEAPTATYSGECVLGKRQCPGPGGCKSCFWEGATTLPSQSRMGPDPAPVGSRGLWMGLLVPPPSTRAYSRPLPSLCKPPLLPSRPTRVCRFPNTGAPRRPSRPCPFLSQHLTPSHRDLKGDTSTSSVLHPGGGARLSCFPLCLPHPSSPTVQDPGSPGQVGHRGPSTHPLQPNQSS